MSDDANDTPAATTALRPWTRGGPTPNPKGRGKGVTNKFSAQLLADFAADWREHGAAAIAKLRKESVVAYVKTACSLVPRELLLQFSRPMEQLSDIELQQAAAVEHEAGQKLLAHIQTIGGEALLEQARREVLGTDEGEAEDDDAKGAA